jgi:hypothetical protein
VACHGVVWHWHGLVLLYDFEKKIIADCGPPHFDCPSPTRTRPIQSVQVLVSPYIARRPGLQAPAELFVGCPLDASRLGLDKADASVHPVVRVALRSLRPRRKPTPRTRCALHFGRPPYPQLPYKITTHPPFGSSHYSLHRSKTKGNRPAASAGAIRCKASPLLSSPLPSSPLASVTALEFFDLE